MSTKSKKLTVFEIVLFGMLGAVMFATKIVMESLPNIHLLALFIISFTIVFRWKALWPIYIYVLLDGLYHGFSTWWLPYLYVWLILWGAVMLLPKNMPKKIAPFVYCTLGALHGLLFGTLYAPMYMLIMKLDFKTTLAWIVAGFSFDLIHGISNLAVCILVIPLVKILQKFCCNE